MDYKLLLYDRIETIKEVNRIYDLENNAYISFSGGKDSTILHYLIDLALPNNKIPRVFIDTGIEYLDIINYVKEMSVYDERFVIIKPSLNIKHLLDQYGYPFKSKQHSHNLAIYWRNKDKQEYNKSLQRYLGIINSSTKFRCPKILLYQFTPTFNIKCSDLCCYKLKKEPAKKWAKDNAKTIVLTGIRKSEGGQRASLKNCIVTNKNINMIKFHPLLVVDDTWINDFIHNNNIMLCKLYYAPYNFTRTGCKGCPFSLDLQNQLEVMRKLLPAERKQCENIWSPVYTEYRRLGFRLKKVEKVKLFYD